MKFHHRWAGAVLFVIMLGATMFSHAAPVSGQGTWETSLQARDFDGNTATIEGYYDTLLNITWLADVDYAITTGYTTGLMTWSAATAWAAGLDPYGSGITGWRLPAWTDTGTVSCNFGYTGTDCGYNVDTATGEMAHLFYVTLGNKAYYDTSGSPGQAGWDLINTGPFFINPESNTIFSLRWYAQENPTDTSYAWAFGSGFQGYYPKTSGNFAWAVHAGDVGAAIVPVPAAAWLFASGLLGLIGFVRRKKQAV